jgi:hypothetical protein
MVPRSACRDALPQDSTQPPLNHRRPRTQPSTADYTNNPDGGGPWIARYTNDQFWGVFDRDDGLVRAWFTTFPLADQIWVDDGTGTGNLENWPWDNALCGPPNTSAMHFQQISHWDPAHSDPNALYIVNANGPVWIVLTSRAEGPGRVLPAP